jgi:hypothetical protein
MAVTMGERLGTDDAGRSMQLQIGVVVSFEAICVRFVVMRARRGSDGSHIT